MKEKSFLKNIKKYHPGTSIEKIKQIYSGQIIKLASNENPFGSCINDETIDLNEMARYPDIQSTPLPQNVAKKLNCDPNQLLFGNGSDELLYSLAVAFLSAKDELISSEHTFSQYQFITNVMGATYKTVQMNDFYFDLNELIKTITKQTKLIAIANPNNPTGTLLTHHQLDDFLSQVPNEVGVILDEAYIEFATSADNPQSIELLKKYQNLIILRTFSKVYGLAGLRLGYAIANPSIIQSIKKVQPPFCVNAMAIKAGLMALKNQAFIQKTLKNNQEQKEVMIESLSKISPQVIQSQANFICFKTHQPSDQIYQALLKKGIIIRPLTSFDLPNYCRVTIGLPDQNKQFLNAMEQIT